MTQQPITASELKPVISVLNDLLDIQRKSIHEIAWLHQAVATIQTAFAGLPVSAEAQQRAETLKRAADEVQRLEGLLKLESGE